MAELEDWVLQAPSKSSLGCVREGGSEILRPSQGYQGQPPSDI